MWPLVNSKIAIRLKPAHRFRFLMIGKAYGDKTVNKVITPIRRVIAEIIRM